MCDCVKAAINHEFIIRDSIYDEVKHDFVDKDYFIPMYQKNGNGKPIMGKLAIKYCPICGEKLTY